MTPKGQILAYLSTHRAGIEASSVDNVVKDIKLGVFYGMSPLKDDEIRQIVVQWAMINAVGLLTKPCDPVTGSPSPGPAKSNSNSDFIDAVNKVINIPHEKVLVGDKDASNITVSVSGLSADLKTSNGTLGAALSWTGTLKLNAESGPFHAEGTLSKDKWELTISLPNDTYVPDMSQFGNVFGKGLNAVGKIADASRGLNSVNDISKVSAIIKPHVAAVQDAVEAVSGIAKAPSKGGMSFGFKIGSPDQMPGQEGIPGGVQGQVVFTWVF